MPAAASSSLRILDCTTDGFLCTFREPGSVHPGYCGRPWISCLTHLDRFEAFPEHLDGRRTLGRVRRLVVGQQHAVYNGVVVSSKDCQAHIDDSPSLNHQRCMHDGDMSTLFNVFQEMLICRSYAMSRPSGSL